MYYNLRAKEQMNIISEDEKGTIWLPSFTFANLLEGNDGALENSKVVHVQPNKDFYYTLSEPSKALNDRIFNGANNSLEMTSTYSTKFNCNFAQNMDWFPFDTQFCDIQIIANGNLEQFAKLTLKSASYSGLQTFSGFVLQKNTTFLYLSE